MASMTSSLPTTPKAAPSTRRVPSFEAFMARRSIGSISSRSASWSMRDSTANSDAGAPGARYAATCGLLSTTSQASTCWFGTSYGPNAQRAPAT